mgnify:CR=1
MKKIIVIAFGIIAVAIPMFAQGEGMKFGVSSTISSSPTIGVRFLVQQSFDLRLAYSFVNNTSTRDYTNISFLGSTTASLETRLIDQALTLGGAFYIFSRPLNEIAVMRAYSGASATYTNQQCSGPELLLVDTPPSGIEYKIKSTAADFYTITLFGGSEIVLFNAVSFFGEAGIEYSTGKRILPFSVSSNPATTITTFSGNLGVVYYF